MSALAEFLTRVDETGGVAPPPARKVRFTGCSALNGVLKLDAEAVDDSGLHFAWSEDFANHLNVASTLAHYHGLINRGEEVKEHEAQRGLAVARCQLDLSRLKIYPFSHQVAGVEALVAKAFFALFDEMGAGKTKQTIDAIMVLYFFGVIDRVVVIAPGGVRDVWADKDLGELLKHIWSDVSVRIKVFHSKIKEWHMGPPSQSKYLTIVCTNYEFIRSKNRLAQLAPFCNEKTLLVLDESWAIKNSQAVQTKATLQLRRRCGRVVLLNGTPVANNPLDLFSQGNMMSPIILNCKSVFAYRSQYAIMGGWQQRQIIGWHEHGLKDLQQRFAPYVLRRLKKDCIDLPDKMPPVIVPVTLTPTTWNIYKQMRDELVVWFGNNVVTAEQAIVKVMRLAQICSGFIGGVEASGLEYQPELHEERPSYVPVLPSFGIDDASPVLPGEPVNEIREIGREKLDSVLEWYDQQLSSDGTFKMVMFHRFRPELARFEKEFSARYPNIPLGLIQGGQTRDRYKAIDGEMVLVQRGERDDAMRLMDPRTAPKGAAAIAGITKTGKAGYNFSAARWVGYVSHDPSLFVREQSEDRVHRPGQIHNVGYTEWCAQGPDGQKTVDHVLLDGLRTKKRVAEYTTSAWIQKLTEE